MSTLPFPKRVLSGPEAVKAAAQLSQARNRVDEWPYPWSYPPPDSIRVKQTGSIPAPAVATQGVVWSYTVPQGFAFYLTHVVQVYVGAGFVPGRGDITWTLDKNTPLGSLLPQSGQLQGFGADLVPLGAFEFPWALQLPEVLKAGDVLRSKVLTTAAIPAGDPNFFTSMFLGWLVAAE